MTSLRNFTLWLFCWTTATLWAGEPAATNAAATLRPRIVVLGDSITAGYGLDPTSAYPALLQKKIDQAGLAFEVVNAGISGDTTAGGLRRVEWALGRGADVLIVALGGNDGLRGISPKQTAENLQGIVRRARAKIPGLSVVLAGMQMPGNLGPEFVAAFQGVFPKVAADQNADLIPFLLEDVGGLAEMNQPDLIHPNARGQKIVAENVWKVLEPVLRRRASSKKAA